ncbi:MAG: hypothetical protein CBC13_02765 [Planctomycetia bacterium TMED53]|nr:MAG: hypothetical protein CBC13_02765 [Planctomycetia bacterium TMED53]
MDSWIFIILFVVVPIINRIIEMNKARAESAAAEAKRMMRKEARQRRQQARGGDAVADQGPQEIQPPPEMDLGGGWVAVGDTPPFVEKSPAAKSRRSGRRTPSPLEPPPPIAQDLPLEVEESPAGLEIFAFPIPDEVPAEEVSSDPASATETFDLKPTPATTAYFSHDLPGSGPISTTRSKRNLRLSRSELRDRLVWREILGPPLSLRKDES